MFTQLHFYFTDNMIKKKHLLQTHNKTVENSETIPMEN